MVNERYSKAMAETLHYLKGISQNDIEKIPNKFIQFLKEHQNENDNFKNTYDNLKED